MVGHLLDPLMFVTWMSQMQQMLVGLIQVNASSSICHPEASSSRIWGPAGRGWARVALGGGLREWRLGTVTWEVTVAVAPRWEEHRLAGP